MTDKEYAEQKKRIETVFNAWFYELQLNLWDIDQRFLRDVDEENPTFLAITNALWPYRRVTFNWYLPNVSTVSDSQLELHVVHEMVHTLLDPLHTPETDAAKLEFATQCVAQSLLWTRKNKKAPLARKP